MALIDIIYPSKMHIARCNIGFPGQFRKFLILFDEGIIQIREINLGHEIRNSHLYFGHSNSHKKFSVYIIQIQIRIESIQIRYRAGKRLFQHSNSYVGIQIRNKFIQFSMHFTHVYLSCLF